MNHAHYSIRKRILSGLVTALVLIMGIAGTVSYLEALHETDEIFSARLATSARVLDSLLTRQLDHATINKPFIIEQPSELQGLKSNESSPVGHPYETKVAFQVWDLEGTMLIRSTSAPEKRLGPLQQGFWERTLDGKQWHTFTLQSGNVWIEVGEEASVRDEIASDVGLVLSSPLFVGSIMLLVVVNLIVIAGFRPLNKLAETLEQREPQDHTPVSLHPEPEEITPLLAALNKLFQRVASMLKRERHFTDAAAHELRTPLAALYLHAQNLVSAGSEEDKALSLAQLLTCIQRSKHLVERMLTYSRISAQTDYEPPVLIDARTEIEHLVKTQQEVLAGTPLHIAVNCSAQTYNIQAPLMQFSMMLRNLLENACKYTSDASQTIVIELENPTDSMLLIRISNAANALNPEEIERIFDPYYRIPNQKSQGNGLGLAIVQEISDQLKWQLQLRQAQGRFIIEVRIPC